MGSECYAIAKSSDIVDFATNGIPTAVRYLYARKANSFLAVSLSP